MQNWKKWACLNPRDPVQRPTVNMYGLKYFDCIFWNSSVFFTLRNFQGRATCQLSQVAGKYRPLYDRTANRCRPKLLHNIARPHMAYLKGKCFSTLNIDVIKLRPCFKRFSFIPLCKVISGLKSWNDATEVKTSLGHAFLLKNLNVSYFGGCFVS